METKILLVASALIILTLFTSFYGATDSKDYADTSKFFAGEYSAKIRATHSYLLGTLHSPFVWLTQSFVGFKATSLIFLFLIIYSVYWISGKDRKTLWLMLLSPIVWYMAPWISPIQLSSLLFLWGYYFLKKYDDKNNLKDLFCSGALLGLSWAFWGSVLFFITFLGIAFLFNKKLIHSIWFTISVFIGLVPQFILDQLLFNFAFFTILRNILAVFGFSIFGGIYGQGSDFGLLNFILVLPFIPIFIYLLSKERIFKENKKTLIFILLSLVLIFLNPQIRFLLILVPIIVLIITKYLDKEQYKKQLIQFAIITIIVVTPYLIQIQYETNGVEFSTFVKNIYNLELNPEASNTIILQDLEQIRRDYPNQIFVVGNYPDSYKELANLYWGEDVKEFVSIEDYQIHLSKESVFAKSFCSKSNIQNRREFCFSLSINKNSNDKTDYGSIKYGISAEDNLDIQGFKLIKKYGNLNLFEKAE